MPDTSPEDDAVGGGRVVANRVLMTLLVAGLLGVVLLPFASMAPNRLVSGQPVGLLEALPPWQWGTLAALAGLMALAALRRPLARKPARLLVLAAALPFLLLVMYGGGDYATRAVAEAGSPAARVSLGAAFWILVFAPVLVALDAFLRLKAGMPAKIGYTLLMAGCVAALFWAGVFHDLSIMREYLNQRDVFAAQLVAHLGLVGAALVPTLLVGLPLGLLARRKARARGPLFGLLNFFQTIPSIALFGLLVAPLSALGEAVPVLGAMGVSGIGAAPAIIALILYSLLPVVRNTYAGFTGVPASTIEAARGMGLTRRQVLWQVEVPLALPVILSGLRIVTVQAIGLTVVAALIGAGGLGTFIFQGLGQYAIDLVLLGAIPTIVLAVAADFFLQILVTLSKPEGSA
ncbi:ABC transporter permease [Caenispirillum salinarum]|uniref:ABC transporter permease n=1 Tax=Caenispirillum salinarum TaxID=859058 RepID=UPI00384A62F4